MSITLYDISVASYLQGLRAAEGFLEKGLAHCREHGIDPEKIVETRLHPDMLPFRFQVHSVAHHSAGAMKALEGAVFAPDRGAPDANYAALQREIAEARGSLEKRTPDSVNALAGRDVLFQAGERKMGFTAEGFVLSFSLPNFYFHAATAYDILRQAGVPVGKRDFMGMPRLKG
jgi:hypothetical protein